MDVKLLAASVLFAFSSGACAQTYSKSEILFYSDNVSEWIMSQLGQVIVEGKTVQSSAYDAKGRPKYDTSFGKVTVEYGYNNDGTIANITSAQTSTTRFDGWKLGVPQRVDYPDSAVSEATVDGNGWVAARTDQNGLVTKYQYDLMGRLSRIEHPAEEGAAWNVVTIGMSQVYEAEYGIAAGHWRRIESSGNMRRKTYFDALGKPILIIEQDITNDATARFRRFSYDWQGRLIFSSYWSDNASASTGVWTEYDVLGRVTSVTQDSELGLLVTRMDFPSGRSIKVTDPKGNETQTAYQMFDEQTYLNPVHIIHPEWVRTEITRDVFGKPLTIRRRHLVAPIP